MSVVSQYGIESDGRGVDLPVDELRAERVRAAIDDSLVARPGVSTADRLVEIARVAAHVTRADCAVITVADASALPGGIASHCADAGGGPGTVGRIADNELLRDTVARGGATVLLDPQPDQRPDGPDVGSLLGVPIVLRGRPAGALYVCDPAGRGRLAEDDVQAAVALATAAANIIERARTEVANARRNRWAREVSQLARELAAGQLDSPLRRVVECLRELAEADIAAMLCPGPEDGTLVVEVAAGPAARDWEGKVVPVAGTQLAGVLTLGEACVVSDGGHGLLPVPTGEGAPESVIAVPLRGSAGVNGVLVAGRDQVRRAFGESELGMASMFAGQVGLALELGDVHRERNQLALIRERDRIARDLHDHVIQRLFALGLTMEGVAAALTGDPAERLATGVDEIDGTIKQIRSTIFRLTRPITAARESLRARTEALLEDLEPALGCRPELAFEGPVDFGLETSLVDDCIAVLRESLTNAAKHAQASSVAVGIRVDRTAVTLEIEDDGVGIPSGGRRSGLANLQARAGERGGTAVVVSGPGAGTHITWTVPLSSLPDGAEAGQPPEPTGS